MEIVKLRTAMRFFRPDVFVDYDGPDPSEWLDNVEFYDAPAEMHVSVIKITGGMYTLETANGLWAKAWASDVLVTGKFLDEPSNEIVDKAEHERRRYERDQQRQMGNEPEGF